jgi:diguanylate cyclase (GGDEF)-like protein/PAS domain S-box-containing protein
MGATDLPPLMLQVLDQLHDAVYITDGERRILFWNRSAERLTGYTAGQMMSVACPQGPLAHVDDRAHRTCQDGCPLAACLVSGQAVEGEAFLRHRNGHRVPVVIRVFPLADEGGTTLGAIQIFTERDNGAGARERAEYLAQLAMLDHLTGVGNRRAVDYHVRRNLEEAASLGRSFGTLCIDIDRFKSVNDIYGHAAGDAVLATVARTLTACLRSYDFLGRFGGDEFIALLPGASEEALARVAERCRGMLEQTDCPAGDSVLRVTASIGATLATSADSPATIVERVDRALYESKRNGRNRVTLRQAAAISSPWSAAPPSSSDPTGSSSPIAPAASRTTGLPCEPPSSDPSCPETPQADPVPACRG